MLHLAREGSAKLPSLLIGEIAGRWITTSSASLSLSDLYFPSGMSDLKVAGNRPVTGKVMSYIDYVNVTFGYSRNAKDPIYSSPLLRMKLLICYLQ